MLFEERECATTSFIVVADHLVAHERGHPALLSSDGQRDDVAYDED
jgi:hypothetical protein